MKYRVTIEETGISYVCDENESILRGMTRLQQQGIPVGCCGGGCGVCKVQVIQGNYSCKPMSRQHVSKEEELHKYALACRTMPCSDLSIRVLGRMKKNVCKQSNGDFEARRVATAK